MVPSSLAPTLKHSRQQAAEASGGTSSDVIYAATLRSLEEFGARGEVLDFGAGTGKLTQFLQQSNRFSRVVSADLMDAPAHLESEWIRGDLNDPLPVPDCSFDTVVAAEVIEHLENPRACARELFRLLRPDGVMVLSTPNNESWRSLLSLVVRGHHVAFLGSSYPAHITALMRADLSRILLEAGFQSPQFRFTNSGGLPAKPTTTWQKISGGFLRGLRFSDNIIVVALKPGASR